MIDYSLKPQAKNNKNYFAAFFALICFYSLVSEFSFYNIPRITAIMMLIASGVVFLNKSLTDGRSISCGCLYIISFYIIFFLSVLVGSAPSTALWILVLFSGSWLMLKDELKIKSFTVFIRLYGWLMILSIIEFILIDTLHWGISLGSVDRILPLNDYHFTHYLFNLVMEPQEVARFQSILHEPGDIGTLNGLLLFGLSGRQQFKKEFLIIIISGLLSMSLAFYILLAFFFIVNISRFKFKTTVLVVLLGIAFYIPMQETIGEKIVYRVVEDKGMNRSSGDLGDEVNKKIRSFDILGEGAGATEKKFPASAGIGKFIYDFGLVSLIILFLGLTILYKSFAIHFRGMYLFAFIAFWMSFVQRENIWEPQIVMAFILLPLLNRFYKDDIIVSTRT